MMCRKSWAAFAAGILLAGTTVWYFLPQQLHRCWLIARSGYAILRHEPARLMTDMETVHFEAVAPGTPVRGHFAVENQGGQRLLLVREGSSCECVEGDYQLTVGPGQVGQLIVAMDTHNTHDLVEMAVNYRTNDPRRPILVLSMVGTVVADKATEMNSVSLDPIPLVEYAPQTLTVQDDLVHEGLRQNPFSNCDQLP